MTRTPLPLVLAILASTSAPASDALAGTTPDASASPSPAVAGLSVTDDGTLLRDGVPFRGIGVNFYNAFYRTLQNPGDTSYREGFAELGRRRIPFARVMGTAYKRLELQRYLDDPDTWFGNMDDVLAHAQANDVGVILSLFWNVKAVPAFVGEPMAAWGDGASATRAFAAQYADDMLSRYADHPAVIGWEFCNEFNLKKDLPANLGTRADIDSAAIWDAQRWFADTVERHDPGAFISSGNAIPRVSGNALRRARRFDPDTRGEFRLELKKDNPGRVNSISIHAYHATTTTNRFGRGDGVAYREVIAEARAAAEAANKPLFVGEFGVKRGDTDDAWTRFNGFLRDFDELDVPLAALWVFDFDHVPEWNVRWDNGRAWQLRLIEQKNAELRARGEQGG